MRKLVACGVVAVSAMVVRPVTGIAAPPKLVACSLLTTAQVTAALGGDVGKGKPMTDKVCEWSQQGKGDDVMKLDVTLTTLERFNKYRAAGNATITTVEHLGDDAYYSVQNANTSQVALCVKKGDKEVIIYASGGKKPTAAYQSIEKAIAEALLPAL